MTVAVDRAETRLGTVTFDGSGVSSGVYFYRLSAGDLVETRTLSLVRQVAFIVETKGRLGIHRYEYYEG